MRALIVDDEKDILDLVQITLARMDIESISAMNLKEAQQALAKYEFHFCLTDMRLPDGSGIELVRWITQYHPQLPVAVITAYGSMETAVAALKAGAFDFVSKPIDLELLRRLVKTALKLAPETIEPDQQDSPLKGSSAVMQRVRQLIYKLARSQAPVFISGESGTGKELAARMIHQLGPRKDQPFIAVNCGAIPTELMESELFGHKKGAFTGAVADKTGLFKEADGGTLFLDEVADLPLSMQVKLLRVIQEKKMRPIGANQEIKIDVRIISATHKDLGQCVAEGYFRQDLYYRLNVISLHMPALRERREDIIELTHYLLHKIARHYGQKPPQIEEQALQALQNYAFPGNVRELENILERAFALCDHQTIRLQDLGLENRFNTNLPALEVKAADQDCLPLMQPGQSLEDYLNQIEKQLIQQALQRNSGNKTAAAKELGISFRSLRYRIAKLKLDQSSEH